MTSPAGPDHPQPDHPQPARPESLGPLIGGLAHDLNNLIYAIQGYADFTAEQVALLAEDDPRLRPAVQDLDQVRSAAQKAARLTRQLLAIAQAQPRLVP
jgi:two-component system, cell cycle sensor histidine kinase and response regulator CckA